MNNKARHNLIDAKCRWRSDRLDGCEFLGTAWSNESDANPPEGDTKQPGGDNPCSLLFSSSIDHQLSKTENISRNLCN